MTSLDDAHLGRLRSCSPCESLTRFGAEAHDAGLVYFGQGAGAKRSVYVARCGATHKTRIHSLNGTGDTGSILGGWAAWTATQGCSKTILSYDLKKGRRYRWTTSGTPKKKCFVMDKTRYAAITLYQVDSGFYGKEEYPIFRMAIARKP